MRKRDWPPSWIPPSPAPLPPISVLLTLCRLISITWSTSLLCQQFSVYFYLFCSEFSGYFLRVVFGRLWIADAVIMLMCCVTEWCIHTELAVVKCVNVLDRSLAGLSSSLKNSRRIFAIRFRLSWLRRLCLSCLILSKRRTVFRSGEVNLVSNFMLTLCRCVSWQSQGQRLYKLKFTLLRVEGREIIVSLLLAIPPTLFIRNFWFNN